mgnify:FL=1
MVGIDVVIGVVGAADTGVDVGVDFVGMVPVCR